MNGHELYTKASLTLNVLDAQRSLYVAQDHLNQSQKPSRKTWYPFTKPSAEVEVETRLAQGETRTR